jgi:hypothetical protein
VKVNPESIFEQEFSDSERKSSQLPNVFHIEHMLLEVEKWLGYITDQAEAAGLSKAVLILNDTVIRQIRDARLSVIDRK